MKVTIIPSGTGDAGGLQYATSYLVNEAIAIDAGSIGFWNTPADQNRVEHIFLTHSHADHVSSLPVFLENNRRDDGREIVIHGGSETLHALETHIFNDRLWPDYFRLAAEEHPFLRFAPLEAENPVELHGTRITPVRVHHAVPTFGFVVEHAGAAVIFGGDSGPTERIWEYSRSLGRVDAVFLEVTFPRGMTDLALRTGHLTPSLLEEELAKLPADARIIVTHMKPAYADSIAAELARLDLPRISIGAPGQTYSFAP